MTGLAMCGVGDEFFFLILCCVGWSFGIFVMLLSCHFFFNSFVLIFFIRSNIV